MSTQEKIQEIEILTEEQIKALPEDAVKDVAALNESLPTKQLQVFVPVVHKYIELREKALQLKLERGDDGEITKESIQAYKDLKSDQRAFNGELKRKISDIKDPINAIRNDIISVDKTFKKESDKIKEAAEKTFAEYEEEKARKKAEAQAKKDAAMQAKIDEQREAAAAEAAKGQRMATYNKVKYEMITEGIKEKTERDIRDMNEDALARHNALLNQLSFDELVKNEDISILEDDKVTELKKHFAQKKAETLEIIEKRFDALEEEQKKAVQEEIENRQEEQQVPLPTTRNEDVAPMNPDVPTGSFPDEENVESFTNIDIRLTTPEEHAKKVLNYVHGLEMSVKLRIEREGNHPALQDLMNRFENFNS